ncbi:MAG: hypothetical protein DRJ05_12375, partial [Bacteroidetes bacterium]
MKKLLLISFIISTFFAVGQNPVYIRGKVVSDDLLPLEKVNISVLNTNIGTSSDKKGIYSLIIHQPLERLQITFSFVGYMDTTAFIYPKFLLDDSINLNIILKHEVIEIPEFVFESSKALFQQKNTRFLDMEFSSDKIFILARSPKHTSIVTINSYGEKLDEVVLQEKYNSFYTDCFNNLH